MSIGNEDLILKNHILKHKEHKWPGTCRLCKVEVEKRDKKIIRGT